MTCVRSVRLAVLVLIAVSLVPRLAAQEKWSAPFESYLAHLAAADAALEDGETAAVRRWLDAVPASERGVEWRWIDAESDASVAAFDLGQGRVNAIAISPDGKLLAAGCERGQVVLCELPSMKPVRTIEAHKANVFCVGFDADGKRLASSSADKGAKVWSVADGSLIADFRNHTYPVSTIRFSPDGKTMASTSYQRPKGGEIRLWDAASAEEKSVLQSGYAPMTCSHWSPDGTKVVGASWDQHLHVFDLSKPNEPVTARLGPEPEYRAAQASALSPDGKIVAVGGKDDTVHLFEAWRAEPVRDLVGHSRWVEGVAFSPDGATIASASADGSIILWNAADGTRLARLRGHRSVVRGLAFEADGRYLWSSSYDGTVRRFDAAAAIRQASAFEFGKTIYHVAENPIGDVLAVAFADGDLTLVSVSDGVVRTRFENQGGWINWLQWSGDGKTLMTGGEKGVRIYDASRGALVHAIDTSHGLDGAAMSHDGTFVAAVSRDKKARFWRIGEVAPVWETECAAVQTRIAFAYDDSVVAIAGPAGAALHDPTNGAVRVKLLGHSGGVTAVRFTHDGATVVTGGSDGTMRLFDVTEGKELRVIKAHDNGVNAITLSRDGKRIAAGGGDDRLKVFDVATGAVVLERNVRDVYALDWSRDGRRLWVAPLASHVFKLDASKE